MGLLKTTRKMLLYSFGWERATGRISKKCKKLRKFHGSPKETISFQHWTINGTREKGSKEGESHSSPTDCLKKIPGHSNGERKLNSPTVLGDNKQRTEFKEA